jgi:hypothetical protein
LCQFFTSYLTEGPLLDLTDLSITIHTPKQTTESVSSKKQYVCKVSKHSESNDLVTPRICINLNLVAVFLETPARPKFQIKTCKKCKGKGRNYAR